VCSWLATVVWTFGFDTVYAMADRRDDASLGLRSSALSLGSRVVPVVRGCYLVTAVTLAIAAWSAEIPAPFWPLWLLATVFMQISCNPLNKQDASMSTYGRHFSRQVQAGSLLWLGLVLARGWGA
jgi:4-hydroxybenzoate polyprenyltransferase